jgi:heat shock protein HslJ
MRSFRKDWRRRAPLLASIAALLLSSCSADGAPTQPELAGPPWILTEIDGSAPSKPGHVAIVFTAEGRFSGEAPCNTYSGSYVVKGDSLALSEIQATAMGCLDEAVSEEEDRFFAALGAITRYGADGASGLVLYHRASARIRATRSAAE